MKTPTNILNNPIQKSIYRSIRKKEILPSKLKAQNLNFPSSTEKVLNVFAKQISKNILLNLFIIIINISHDSFIFISKNGCFF